MDLGQHSTFTRKFDRLFHMRLDRLNRLIHDGETMEGSWEMGSDGEIRYRRRGSEQEVVLTGDILSADPNSLTFHLREVQQEEDVQLRQMSLRGRWRADERNRLTFLVEREQGPKEVLTLEGGWEVGPKNEILYRFERTDLKRRSRSLHEIRFDGYWDLGEERGLSYVLDADTDSVFRFRGAFQTASIRQMTGALRYQIGLEAEGRSRLQTVTLFGKWKLSRDLSLEFEVPYSGRFRRAISFGATYSWDRRTAVSAKLTAPDGGPLGLELTLHREFLRGQGEAFVRLRRSLEETAAEAGVRVRW